MSISNADMAGIAQRFDAITTNIGRVIQGKDDVVRQAVICLLAEGHLLIEDVPGLGKTTLARAMAASFELTWNRIQFTPDLLPSDVTGVTIFNQAKVDFEFRPGAIFANVVVGDEINRASPKTQSALLEVMEEGTVTTDAVIYPVPNPFMVIATQNPIDMEGTYQLPEAQLDRFLMKLSMGYPDPIAEVRIIHEQRNSATVENLSPVLSNSDLLRVIDLIKQIEVSSSIEEYIVSITQSTRTAPEVRLGASPRGSLGVLKAARASAAVAGRTFVTPEDVKAVAVPVLAHRLLMRPEAELQGRTNEEIVLRALQTVPVPRNAAG
jgi:MoxR-like ATPase